MRFNNYARKTGDQYGRPYYEWRVFVNEPPSVLQTIEQVDYVLHPTFPDPFRTSRNRDNAFELAASGGEFTIVITVHFTNGKEAKTGYYLNLSKPWPPEAQRRTTSTSNLRIRLEKVHVEWDGTANLDVKAGAVTVIARNNQDPKRGSFVFSFSASAQ